MSVYSSFAQSEVITSIPKKGTVYTTTGSKIRYKSVEEKENTYVFITSNRTIIEVEKSKISFSKISGHAFTKTGTQVKFKLVEEKENTFLFTTKDNIKVEIERDKIAQIKLNDGNRFSEYFSISGTSGLIASTTFILLIDPSIFLEPRPLGTFIILPSFILGTIGGIIGCTKKKYKTIYQPFNLNNNISHLKLKITSPDDIPSLGLVYTF